MTPARIAILVVALVASVGLALLVHGMFTGPKPAAAPVVVSAGPVMTRVLVAKTNLGVGDRLSPENMNWQPWPAATLNAAYITDGQTMQAPKPGAESAVATAKSTVTDIATGGGPKLQSMVGSVVREPIYAGEPITSFKIVRSGDSSYMAVRLPAGMRAMSLPLSVESGAGGFIQPGDHVDILSTHADPSKSSGGNGMMTETILSNALVLAIDQHTDAPKTGATLAGVTITIEVPDVDADAVARARTQGGLTMALRSYADIAGHTQGAGANDAVGVKIFRGGSTAETVSAQ
jgi:pilus assembly protein CpaB